MIISLIALPILLIVNSLMIQGLYRSSTFEWKTIVMNNLSSKQMKLSLIDKQFNMLLWWVRYYSLKYIGKKWSKPIITCPTCMASLHSTYFYWIVGYPYFAHSLIMAVVLYPMYVLALAGLNTFITSVIDK